jgi:hypothetical protein
VFGWLFVISIHSWNQVPMPRLGLSTFSWVFLQGATTPPYNKVRIASDLTYAKVRIASLGLSTFSWVFFQGVTTPPTPNFHRPAASLYIRRYCYWFSVPNDL